MQGLVCCLDRAYAKLKLPYSSSKRAGSARQFPRRRKSGHFPSNAVAPTLVGLNFAWAAGITGNKSTDNSTLPLSKQSSNGYYRGCDLVIASRGSGFCLLSHTCSCLHLQASIAGGTGCDNSQFSTLTNRCRTMVTVLFS